MDKIIIATHNGTFHTDDVFAAATLMLFYQGTEVDIVRTRDAAVLATADIVFDVGAVYDVETKRFDHHQVGGAGIRENGIPYASFGLIWKEYGATVAGSEEVAEIIDEQLVQPIDGVDNAVINKISDKGIFPFTVTDMVGAFRPTWKEDRLVDEAFFEVVDIAVRIISRTVAQAQGYVEARSKLEDSYALSEKKEIIEIGREYPGWQELMSSHSEPLYVVYERESGGWGVKGVRKDPALFDLRKPFPASWAGLRDSTLQEVTGVNDAEFCHIGRFLIVASSREGALKLAELALNA